MCAIFHSRAHCRPCSACEFLNKLDLTCNFIDVDTLEASIEHLRSLLHLKELYLMGNPCQDWPSHRDYIIHCLPQLKSYDGKEVRIVTVNLAMKLNVCLMLRRSHGRSASLRRSSSV